MKKKHNHTVAGLAFVAVCVVVAALLYFGVVRSGGVAAEENQQFVANDTGPNLTNTSAGPQYVDPADIAAAGSPDGPQANTSGQAVAASTSDDAAGPSICEGYWLGKDVAISVSREQGGDFTIARWQSELGHAESIGAIPNPLKETATFDEVPDSMGTVGSDTAAITYANFYSVDMKCGSDLAINYGSQMRRVDKADFQSVVSKWPAAR